MKNQIHHIKSVLCVAAVLGGSLGLALAQTNLAIGTVLAWGDGSSGHNNVPSGLNDVIGIADGWDHSLALKSNGMVVAWGAGGPGQTGVSDYGQSTVPGNLNGVIGIAGGGYHSLALKSNGTVVAWGAGGPGRTGSVHEGQSKVPTNLNGVISVAAGFVHSLALKSNGTVVAWGSNSSDQTNVPAGLSGVRAIAAGQYHNLALKSDGTVVAWGYNYYGQRSVPAGLSGVVGIAGGRNHSLVLKSNGTVVAWGDNYNGQTNVPAGLSGVICIAAGAYHSLALKSDGAVVAWGAVDHGQSTVPASLNGAAAIAAGGNHSLALAAGPTIQTPPTSQTVEAGSTVELSVGVSGTPPFSYQWLFNHTNSLVGASNSVLWLTNVQLSQSGVYSVVVTNAFGAVTSSPAMLTVQVRVPPGTVVAATEAALRAAMAAGGMVTFACDGTIYLSATISNTLDTVLDGSGHQVTISGSNAVRIFYVATNVNFTVKNLTLADGASVGGSAILNDGGRVHLNGVTLRTNLASTALAGSDLLIPRGAGGALFNRGGAVGATNCAFAGNTARSLTSDPHLVQTCGGAIYNESGTVTLEQCSFVGNRVVGGDSTWTADTGADVSGGAVHNRGMLWVNLCTFTQNSASAGRGGTGSSLGSAGGTASGGAVFNEGTLTADSTSFSINSATGGAGGRSAAGGRASGGAVFNAGTFTADWTSFSSNNAAGGAGGGGGSPPMDSGEAGYPGGLGGAAQGAAVGNAGTSSISRSTFASNSAAGGSGGSGGLGGIIMDTGAPGGDAGDGGEAMGVACNHGGTGSPSLSLVNCTFAGNFGRGGVGGLGGDASRDRHIGQDGGDGGDGGDAYGGIYGTRSLTNCTVAWNQAIGGLGGAGGSPSIGERGAGTAGSPGGNGIAFGVTDCSGSGLINTLIASNSPAGNDTFTDPKLGPLANNGGPTLTMALLPGSPAIDAATSGAPATDQRGVPRPVGSFSDFGAYEFTAVLEISQTLESGINVLVHGPRGQPCRLLTSTNLADWQCIATNQIGADGTVLFQDNFGTGETQRFYRVALP